MITVKTLYFNALRVCTHIVWDETSECVIIDPGCSSEAEFGRLRQFISQKGLKPVKILLTHGHFDHILGAEDTAVEWNLDIYVSPKDHCQIDMASRYSSMMGIEYKPVTAPLKDIEDGDAITFGQSTLEVIATPGHTKGGVCFYDRQSKVLFSGDTLFAGSIGRTDFEYGNYDELMESIMRRIATLPHDVEVFPGHGPSTDIGQELSTNPFLQPC